MKPVIRLFISGPALVTTVRGSQARRLPYGGYGFVQLHNQGTPRLISRRQNGEKENFMTSRLDVTRADESRVWIRAVTTRCWVGSCRCGVAGRVKIRRSRFRRDSARFRTLGRRFEKARRVKI